MSLQNSDTCRIGVTGTIGSGKSLVGKILKAHSVPVLDVDDVVHILLDSDLHVQTQISDRFGKEYLLATNANSQIVDRPKLGKLVFQSAEERRALESIVHPAVHAFTEKWIIEQNAPVTAVLIPLLFEAGKPGNFQQIWAVVCDETLLRERLKARNDFSDEEISKRLSAQLPQSEKAARADSVIDNSGSVAETQAQVASLLSEIHATLGLQTSETLPLVH
jgi:dephospho-CoA kinase